jgi:hypothetical protein
MQIGGYFARPHEDSRALRDGYPSAALVG